MMKFRVGIYLVKGNMCMIKVRFEPTPALSLVFNYVTSHVWGREKYLVWFFFSDDNYDMGNNE